MQVKLTTLLLTLLVTGQAAAHAGHAHAAMHATEHLVMLLALAAPALLFVRPAMRRLAAQRAK